MRIFAIETTTYRERPANGFSLAPLDQAKIRSPDAHNKSNPVTVELWTVLHMNSITTGVPVLVAWLRTAGGADLFRHRLSGDSVEPQPPDLFHYNRIELVLFQRGL